MLTINGKSWVFDTTDERQIINGRETHCGCYHDTEIGRILIDGSLSLDRQLELAAKAAIELSNMITSSSHSQPELVTALDLMDVPLRKLTG